jgi:hypothetical protein
MAGAKSSGNGRLDETVAMLNQSMATLNQSTAALNQAMATFLIRCAETDARIAKIEAEKIATDRIHSERFARLEAILIEHSRILHALPDVIRDKIGFKVPEARKTS